MFDENKEIPEGAKQYSALATNEIITPLDKAKLFWEQNKAAIKEQMIALLETRFPADYPEEEREYYRKKIDELIEGEERFTTSVIQTVEKVITTSDQETILLFDIDETIASPRMDNNHYISVIRPAVLVLFSNYLNQYITTGKLRVGLLSTRSKDAMIQQLDAEDNLLPIANTIDQELVFSTKDNAKYNEGNTTDVIAQSHSSAGSGILKDESIQEDSADYLMFVEGDRVKLDRLQTIRDEYPQQNIIAVDDMVFPRNLNEDKGVFGVSLKRNGEFFFPY